MPKIYLYAEVLTHLRQLTLHASLRTEKNEDTKIDISSDKKVITVIHDGESSSLYLPTQISGTARVTFPLDKKTEISARVQIEDLEQWKETDAAGIEAPWIASELSIETVINCLQCGSEILPTGTISSWKDLPNQHWADVMDLWFCHKPHEHLDGKHEKGAAKAKGFSAHSKIVSQQGVGLVDLVSFAVHPADCNIKKNLNPENENTLKPVPVHCTQCQRQIGLFSNHDNLVRLDKSSLSVKARQDMPCIAFPPAAFVSAQLLELIESTAIRKVVAYDQTFDFNDYELEKRVADIQLNSNSGDPLKEASQSCSETKSDSPSIGSSPQADTPGSQYPNSHSSNPTTSKTQQPPQPLLLWIFNPDIYYSSSRLTTDSDQTSSTENNTSTSSKSTSTTSNTTSPSSPTSPSLPSLPSPTSHLHPHRALKIFYQPLSPSTLPSYLSQSHSKPQPQPQYEPLPLPPHTLHALHNTLQTSTTLLPTPARTFETWQVGLLNRYERNPSAQKALETNPLARGLRNKEIAADGRPKVTRWEMPAGAAALYL